MEGVQGRNRHAGEAKADGKVEERGGLMITPVQDWVSPLCR